jgi:hypothetical protein
MAYSDTVNMVTGDTLPQLNFSLKDSSTAASGKQLDEFDSTTWAPLALNGASVILRVRAVGSTTILKTVTCSLVGDGSSGQVTADLTAFDQAGTYEGELEITFSGGGKQTVYDLIKFKVRSDFD